MDRSAVLVSILPLNEDETDNGRPLKKIITEEGGGMQGLEKDYGT
jgi:hypothetical protein